MSDTGGPAFPSHGSMGEVTHEGMFLRDYFAAKAMAAILRNWQGARANAVENSQIAVWAYEMADAMLNERAK